MPLDNRYSMSPTGKIIDYTTYQNVYENPANNFCSTILMFLYRTPDKFHAIFLSQVYFLPCRLTHSIFVIKFEKRMTLRLQVVFRSHAGLHLRYKRLWISNVYVKFVKYSVVFPWEPCLKVILSNFK